MNLVPGEKLTALVVDDDVDVRETLAQFLELMEIFTMIVEAEDGAQAFLKTRNQDFDLIITDLLMPKENGLDFISNYKDSLKLRSPAKSASIIVLSGNLNGEEVTKAIGLGVKHALTKPCSAQEFVSKVEKVLLKEQPNKVTP